MSKSKDKRREFLSGEAKGVSKGASLRLPTIEDLIAWSIFEYLVNRTDIDNLKPTDVRTVVTRAMKGPPADIHKELYDKSKQFKNFFYSPEGTYTDERHGHTG